jgi:cytochrome c oxidase assembly factor CtaG
MRRHIGHTIIAFLVFLIEFVMWICNITIYEQKQPRLFK